MSRISRSTRMIGVVLAMVGWPALGFAQEASKESSAQRDTMEKAMPAVDDSGWGTDAQEGGGGEAEPKQDGARARAPSGSSRTASASQAETRDVGKGGGEEAAQAKREPAKAEDLDGATYQIRLRDLEQRVDELKEQIRRSHTRLSLLSDTILAAGVGGARAEILFQNELSAAFRLTEAVFVLDGAVQYRKQDETGTLAAQETIPIFSGAIPSGDHTLQVLIKLRGHGYGVFSYLRGYQFELRDAHSFTVTDGKVIELKATAWERGGATTPLEERPAMRYSSNLRSLGEMPAAAPAKGSQDKGSGAGRASGSVSVGGGN